VLLKLLKADFPKTDERWQRFYSKFMVMDSVDSDRASRKRYSKIETQIGLIFLSQGSIAERARAIMRLYMKQLQNEANESRNISGAVKNSGDDGGDPYKNMMEEDKMNHIKLSNENLRCIISIFVNISLTLLPIYGSDYPPQDRRKYYKLLMQWTRRSPAVIEHFMGLFRYGAITMNDFIKSCEEHKAFNVLEIREVAKRTAVMRDSNPHINKDAMSDKELFGGRLS